MEISPVIEVEQLFQVYRNPDVMIFDASSGKTSRENYQAAHLQGAYFVDLNSQLADIKSDPSQGGRHPLPLISDFARTLGVLGISKDTHVVVYDDKNGSNAAARFWWMLRAVGHRKVQVLDGGLDQARRQGFPVTSILSPPVTPQPPYPAQAWQLPTVSMEEVEKFAKDPGFMVVDVRDKDRYDGKYEPIDLVAGHIPGAVNVPFTENLDGSGTFLPPAQLKKKYSDLLGTLPPENLVVHCGSGVTACHTLLALAYAGLPIPRLYVGSWSEWSRNGKTISRSES